MTATRPGRWYPPVNGTLMAQRTDYGSPATRPGQRIMTLTCIFTLERVTGIEPALSAWEADVLPLNYTRAYEHGLVMLSAGRACTVSAQTWYRNR
jgi:hypothetical protein